MQQSRKSGKNPGIQVSMLYVTKLFYFIMRYGRLIVKLITGRRNRGMIRLEMPL